MIARQVRPAIRRRPDTDYDGAAVAGRGCDWAGMDANDRAYVLAEPAREGRRTVAARVELAGVDRDPLLGNAIPLISELRQYRSSRAAFFTNIFYY